MDESVGAGKTMLDIPPRYMWGWSPPGPPTASGYCGSASVQSTALYFGNWITQMAVRDTSGGHDAAHSILLGRDEDLPTPGTSVTHACAELKLDCSAWDYDAQPTPQHASFLSWAKDALDAGSPVIIGVYWVLDSDPDYDHIVPMIGYEEGESGGGSGKGGAVFLNDFHANATRRYDISDFVSSRRDCSVADDMVPADDDGRVYEWCLPSMVDYGVIVKGNADAGGELLRTQLVALSSWSEPDYSEEDELGETPVRMSATVRVTGLETGSSYVLLRYDDPSAVPDRAFLAGGGFVEKIPFTAEATNHAHAVTFMSNSTTLFRCVRAPPGLAGR